MKGIEKLLLTIFSDNFNDGEPIENRLSSKDMISIDTIVEFIKEHATPAIKRLVLEAETKGLKYAKKHLDGKYDKEIIISGDAQVVLDKAINGFVDVSNRITELKKEIGEL